MQSASTKSVAVIGAGPAGLMAAEQLARAGIAVTIYDRMPSPGRKLLMAGRGGLNLTHSEPLAAFLTRYGDAPSPVLDAIRRFPPEALIGWAHGLGQDTFVGSSGRVFPKALKASPLLRAWLARLAAAGVVMRTRHRWIGWDPTGALAFVDETVVGSKNGVEVLITLADELGAHRAVADVPPLVRLSKTKSFANHFGLRRAVVAALAKIPDRQALGALIEMLPQLGGEAGADAIEHLTQVTQQIFAANSDAWARWWDDNRDSFEYPTRSIQTPYRQASLEGASGNYYGLPLFAQRLVFVLDTSGSMNGQRIEAAKRELTRAIGGLPEHAHFGVVVFNGNVSVWQRRLVAATESAKKTAMHYVSAQATHSNTASYDALEAAMEFDTEAIYFLSDGAPYGGKITAPVDIVAAISAANKTRRISIYTIGIGAGIPGGPLDMFLKTLAEQNLGLYRRVDG